LSCAVPTGIMLVEPDRRVGAGLSPRRATKQSSRLPPRKFPLPEQTATVWRLCAFQQEACAPHGGGCPLWRGSVLADDPPRPPRLEILMKCWRHKTPSRGSDGESLLHFPYAPVREMWIGEHHVEAVLLSWMSASFSKACWYEHVGALAMPCRIISQ